MMSINSHLIDLSSNLVLSSTENSNIKTSIETLSKRLNWYFDNGQLYRHFQFGSNTRGTILPRTVDANSDVDYMVVFKNPNGYKPETLLNYLRSFMNKYYSKSEIYKDSPTMVLELNHIKFELVPAVQDAWGNLSIPSKTNLLSEWMSTDPMGFNKRLTDANQLNTSRIKPLIRLMKQWNTTKLGHQYSSFLLEKWIVDKFYYSSKSSLKEYVYDCIDTLIYSWDDSKTFKDRLNKAKEIINNCKIYEANGYIALAENEIKKLFPEI
ncbi:SMODS domain-containing nucleotidyltransferase [Peribacillus sp. SCS-26]|uniref:SMODS domain-containing nucleotidyltransferase n=1 Tax=Paraperibacillus marinus TaxID=3115295 RepID=UPI0039061487